MSISALDFVLLQFGSPGYYQIFLGFLLCCFQLPIVFTEYLFKYYTYEPPHRCQVPVRNLRFIDASTQLNMHKNEWFPVEKRPISSPLNRPNIDQLLLINSNSSSHVFDQCNIYLDPIHHWKGTQPCPGGWEFWTPDNEQNLITEFNLVCDQKYHVTILFYALCIAAFSGSILFGLLADKWGRCKTMNLTLYLFVASSLSVYFAADIVQFSIFYIGQVFFVNGLQVAVFVLLVEILPTPFHLQACIIWVVFRIITSLLVPLLVCVINNWRYLQLSIAVPSFAFFTYIFVIPSSPLWLTVVKRNLPKATKVLGQFGKFNGKPITSDQLSVHLQNLYTSTLSLVCQIPDTATGDIAQPHPHQQVYVPPKLSKPGPILRWFLLTNFYLFFVASVINSDILTPHSLILHQNQHANQIYHSFLDFGVIILAYHIAIWLGARAVQAIFFLLSGSLIVFAIVLKEYFKSKLGTDFEDQTFDYRLLLLPPTLIVIARSLGQSILAFIWFYAIKTVPTNIRATGLGLCLFWSQIAKLSIPHLLILSEHLPYNVLLGGFGVMTIVAGALTCLFPKLNQKPLPNILGDLDCRNNFQNISSTLSSKQYPSYQDLKLYRRVQPVTASAVNVYTINPKDATLQPVDPSLTFTKAMATNEIMSYIQPNSMSGSMLPNETEKSSISSSTNTLSKNVHDHSLIQMSPSTSFIQMNPNNNNKPTYIAYDNLGNEIVDLFSVGELDNEFTVENFQTTRSYFEPRSSNGSTDKFKAIQV